MIPLIFFLVKSYLIIVYYFGDKYNSLSKYHKYSKKEKSIMEITIKCDQREEATVHTAIKELCPYLSELMCNQDVEIRSLDVKFLKSGEEILIYMSPDMTNMTVRKISAAGSVFKILYHIMNDSFADLVHRMGDFDIMVNGEFLEDEYGDDTPVDIDHLFSSKDKIPTAVFEGI